MGNRIMGNKVKVFRLVFVCDVEVHTNGYLIAYTLNPMIITSMDSGNVILKQNTSEWSLCRVDM